MSRIAISILCFGLAVQFGHINQCSGQFRMNTSHLLPNALLGAIPVQFNPSYTGAFEGNIRLGYYIDVGVNDNYSRNFAVDLPIAYLKNGSYFSLGVQASNSADNSISGRGECSYSALSAAYCHKFDSAAEHPLLKNATIAGGMQCGLSLMEIGSYHYHSLVEYHDGLSLQVGVHYSKTVSNRFSYTIGYAYKNLHDMRSNDYFQRPVVGRYKNSTITLGASYKASRILTWQPAVLMNVGNGSNQAIIGTDAHFRLSKPGSRKNIALFMGIYAEMVNVDYTIVSVSHAYASIGVEFFNCKLGFMMGDDEIPSDYSSRPGMQLAFKAIPNWQTNHGKQKVPCSRF